MHETCELGTLGTYLSLFVTSINGLSLQSNHLFKYCTWILFVRWTLKKTYAPVARDKRNPFGSKCKHPPPVNISPPHKIWHHLQMETSLPLSPVLFVEGFLTVSGPQSDWFQSTVGYAGFMEIISVLRKRVHVGHRRLCRTMQSIPPLPPESLKRRRRVLVDNPRSIQRMLGYLSNVCTDT